MASYISIMNLFWSHFLCVENLLIFRSQLKCHLPCEVFPASPAQELITANPRVPLSKLNQRPGGMKSYSSQPQNQAQLPTIS